MLESAIPKKIDGLPNHELVAWLFRRPEDAREPHGTRTTFWGRQTIAVPKAFANNHMTIPPSTQMTWPVM